MDISRLTAILRYNIMVFKALMEITMEDLFKGFAEAIQEGSEYPVVTASESKLTFDKNNQYDFKKLPKDADVAPQQGMAVNSAGPNW